MRLDHLLSKEEVGAVLLFRCEGVSERYMHLPSSLPWGASFPPQPACQMRAYGHTAGFPAADTREYRQRKEPDKIKFLRRIRGSIASGRNLTNLNFWRRYARGKHPYPSRTRWLSPGRPMVLYWRRYGRAGGCQDQRGLSSAGRAPALQAGGREFESLSLQCGVKLQACTLKTEY